MRMIATIVFATAAMALANPAEARYSSQEKPTLTQFCGDHYGSCAGATVAPEPRAPARRRVHRAAKSTKRVGLLIDKPQEYVKPVSPAEKLIPREDYNLIRSGMVRVKTAQGFYITVNPIDASKFLKFFALLKEHGHKVNPAIIGCYSPGGHKPGSNHHIGRACDNQYGWNKAPPYMYHAGNLIRQAGLYDGCSFGDCGHVEAVRGLYNKKPNLYAALEKFKAYQATANYQP